MGTFYVSFKISYLIFSPNPIHFPTIALLYFNQICSGYTNKYEYISIEDMLFISLQYIGGSTGCGRKV